MKYLKYFEKISKPQINDFLIFKLINDDLCVGYIKDIIDDNVYKIRYFPPSGGFFDDLINLKNIIYFSDNEKYIEDYVKMLKNTKKYNI